MKNVYSNIEVYVEGKNITYTLSAGIECDKEFAKYMPSLSFDKDKGEHSEKNLNIWDNELYIKRFYENVIRTWGTSSLDDYECLKQFLEIPGSSVEDIPLLVELFNAAEKLQLIKLKDE